MPAKRWNKLTAEARARLLQAFNDIPNRTLKSGLPGKHKEPGRIRLLCERFGVTHFYVYQLAGWLGTKSKR